MRICHRVKSTTLNDDNSDLWIFVSMYSKISFEAADVILVLSELLCGIEHVREIIKYVYNI